MCGGGRGYEPSEWKIKDISWDKQKNHFEVKAVASCYLCGMGRWASWKSWNSIPKMLLADIKCPRCGNENINVENVYTSVSGKETQITLVLKCRRCAAIEDRPIKKIFRFLGKVRRIEAGPNSVGVEFGNG